MVTLKGYPSFFSPFKTTGPEPQSGVDLNSAIFRRPYQLVLLHIPTFANWSLKRLILDVFMSAEERQDYLILIFIFEIVSLKCVQPHKWHHYPVSFKDFSAAAAATFFFRIGIIFYKGKCFDKIICKQRYLNFLISYSIQIVSVSLMMFYMLDIRIAWNFDLFIYFINTFVNSSILIF